MADERATPPRPPGRRNLRATFPRAVPDASPALERVIEQRYASALGEVTRLKADHPEETPEQLANRLIRRYAKDMAIGGAVAGGAAAAPVAGMAVAAASAGVESAYSVGRLGELIMSIGLLYGHAPDSVDDRRTAVLAVMGMADGAAVGVSGLAARAGVRGGARVLKRLPSPGVASGGAGRKALNKVATGKGPWSAAALIPYGIGAGVGAAGNALLVRAIGRAAKEYYGSAARLAEAELVIDDDAAESEIVDDIGDDSDIVAAGVVDAEVVDAEVVDAEVVDADVVDPEILDADVADPPATH